MVGVSEIEEEFSQFGIDVDPKVLERFRDFCVVHGRDAESIVEIWMSYSIRKLDGESPSIDNLQAFEKDELGRLKGRKDSSQIKSEKPKVYNPSCSDGSFGDGIIDAYGESSTSFKRDHLTAVSGLSPSVYSSEVVTPSQKYNERSNAGDVIFAFGSLPDMESREPCSPIIDIRSSTYVPVTEKYTHMFERLRDKVDIANELSLQMEFENTEIYEHRENSEGKSLWMGRIVSEAQEKLNRGTVMLESPVDGKCSLLDLRTLDSFSLFPGQTVVVLADGIPGQSLKPSKISLGIMPDIDTSVNFEGDLEVFVAAGPYTLSSNLLYEPLTDLLKIVRETQPEVCVFVGPFVDSRHQAIVDCQLAETFDSLFEKQLNAIVEVAQQVKTEFLIIPSFLDVHHEMVYPTPPFPGPKHPIKNITMLPDPAIVSISGINLAVTSVDILFHLKREELVGNPKEDVFTRLSRHLLLQRQFYPLRPPGEGLPINYQKFATGAVLDIKPHILLLPSNFKHFAKDVDGCLVINPERAAKGQAGGSYARLKVRAKQKKINVLTEIIKI